jgi:copper oxidase (laccase) domain-containing protein
MTLEIITDDLLDAVPHGFFTRKGGASSGVYTGLNCGFGSSDQHEIVAINRGRVANAMGVAPNHMMGVHQFHSADVVTITQATTDKPKADALVTNVPGLALSVLTADCQPVLFADPVAGVVGAAHAG